MPKTQSYTVAGVAKALGCGMSYAYSLVYSGKLEAAKINGTWRISAAAVDALIARRASEAQSQ